MTQSLHFTVDSALLQELGEKLVESVHIALSELVKNAYDADATEVEIIFDQNDLGEDRIVIIDNGIGMNFESVSNYWMRIATANKELRKESRIFGRPLTGAKGIGRFACRRLGKRLTLITRGTTTGLSIGEQTSIEQTKVIFEWMRFIPGEEVTSISCPGEREILDKGVTGTTLIIENVAPEWKTRGINYLKRQLAVLSANRGIRREGYAEDPGFEVLLQAQDLEGGIRDIRLDLMNAGWGTLTAVVNSKGEAICQLDALGIGKKKIISPPIFHSIRDVNLEIAIMVDQRDQMRDTSILSKQSLQEILDDWGGVQIRYRGFRVYPYGNDDWLNIDKDRGVRKASTRHELQAFANTLRGVDPSRAMLSLLSMKSYVGTVFIAKEVPGLDMKANREGFLESPQFEQLKSFVRFAIDWSTIWRDYHLRQESTRKTQQARDAFEEISGQKTNSTNNVVTALNHIRSTVEQIGVDLDDAKKNQLVDTVARASTLIHQENESLLIELSQLRLIASTATLLLIFSHEVRSLLGFLEQTRITIKQIGENSVNKRTEIELRSISSEFEELKNRLEDLLQLTSLVSNYKNRQETRLALKTRLTKVIKIFELITKKYTISINIQEVPNSIIVNNLIEAELYSILINAISNAIKAVIAVDEKREIGISAEIFNGQTIIQIKDTGIGIDKNLYEEVFTPFISDPDGNLYSNLNKRLNPEDAIFVGKGSGIGLGIIREIMRVRGGMAYFTTPVHPWNTVLTIKI